MELLSLDILQNEVTVAPIGDLQYSGKTGPTATEILKKHIKRCQSKNAYFVGLGDYTDFMSPSNRQRLRAAGLYDTAGKVIENAAVDIVKELHHDYLGTTNGRWLGLVKGHHCFDLLDGTNTDYMLAKMLGTDYLGTSALIRIRYGKHREYEATLYLHHGRGGGSTKGAPLNTLDRIAAGFDADVFINGHTCQTPATKFSRVVPTWDENGKHGLKHKEILLVNSGGFMKTSIVGNTSGRLPAGDYAEEAMLVPAPLTAPIITLDNGKIYCEI